MTIKYVRGAQSSPIPGFRAKFGLRGRETEARERCECVGVAPATALGAQCEPGCGRVRVTIRAVFAWWGRAPADDVTRVVAARAVPLAFEWSAGRWRSVVAGDDAFVDGWWALVAGAVVRGAGAVVVGTRTVLGGCWS